MSVVFFAFLRLVERLQEFLLFLGDAREIVRY